jgi:hypothetical protein
MWKHQGFCSLNERNYSRASIRSSLEKGWRLERRKRCLCLHLLEKKDDFFFLKNSTYMKTGYQVNNQVKIIG